MVDNNFSHHLNMQQVKQGRNHHHNQVNKSVNVGKMSKLYDRSGSLVVNSLISSGKGAQLRQSHMNFGTSCKNDFERVRQSMFDNQRRDTQPSLRSIVGHEDRVWNLRPLQKEKHIDKDAFRYKAKTQMERIHELNMTEINKYMMNEEIGLPPINKKQQRLFKAVE